jgi:hypothetical protein
LCLGDAASVFSIALKQGFTGIVIHPDNAALSFCTRR